jgi:hypothetical protein
MDEALRTQARRSSLDPEDYALDYRARVQAWRAGKPFVPRVGEVVEITEVDSPWLRVRSRWIVLRVFAAEDAYARPITQEGKLRPAPTRKIKRSRVWRVVPSTGYLEKGLYLTCEDVATAVPIKPRSDSPTQHPTPRPRS